MGRKILNTLTNNIAYKILALVLASVLWIVVYNLDDPTITRTFTTSVVVTNTDAVADLNKTFEMDGNTVTFRVSGARSYLSNLEDSNFTAVADMSNLVMSDDEESGTVPITITSNQYSRYITFSSGTQYLSVTLEDLMSKQFVISAKAEGEVAEGYALGSVTITNPNVLKVSGPASIVSTIASVEAVIDVEGMSSDLSDNIVPILYDVNGNEVDSTRLTFSSDTVIVEAEIVPTKEVSVTFTPSGTPESGYSVTEVTLSPNTVTIQGTASVLNAISSIEIPQNVISVDGADETIVTTVDLSEYLPDGASLVNEEERTISVTITIEGSVSKQVTIPAENIEIVGIESGLEAQLGQTSVVVTISGMANVLNALSGEDLTGTVDVSGLSAGRHTVALAVTASDDYTASDKNVTVILTDISDTNEEDTSENTSENTEEDSTTSSEEETAIEDTETTEETESVDTTEE